MPRSPRLAAPASRGIRTERFAQVEVRSPAELRAWLAAHHAQEASVWVVRWQRKPGAPYVSRRDVLDELLCWGWVDGLARRLDDARTMQLASPRRTQAWTAFYRARVAALEAAGRMAEPGRAAVRRAQAAGTWEGAPDVDALVVPPDLSAALDADAAAGRWFDESAPSYRRNALRWIAKAVRADTRARRIAEVAARAARREKVPQL
jgi:uncharacterized protein YdeI (YjbR/CyaY-like superfamily)